MKFQYVTSGFPTKRGDPPSENKLASKPGKVEANQKQSGNSRSQTISRDRASCK